jgi:hypothetical protein
MSSANRLITSLRQTKKNLMSRKSRKSCAGDDIGDVCWTAPEFPEVS